MKPDSNFDAAAANPQGWNLYTYVKGNPVNFNDPTGHMTNIPEASAHSMPYMSDPFISKDFAYEYRQQAKGVEDSHVAALTTVAIMVAAPDSTELGPIGSEVDIEAMLIDLGVPADQARDSVSRVVDAYNQVPAGSEAPFFIGITKEGVVAAQAGPAVAGRELDPTAGDALLAALKDSGWTTLAYGHVQGPGLDVRPSGDIVKDGQRKGDTAYVSDLLSRLSPSGAANIGHRFVMLSDGMLWNYRNGKWNYAFTGAVFPSL